MHNRALRLTKSQFLEGRQCLKRLFLSAQGLPKPPDDDTDRFRREVGEQVNNVARSRYPDGLLCGWRIVTADELTELRSCHSALFEVSVVAEGLLARVDILERLVDGWQIVEVKSSGSVKSDQIADVAFQKEVLERAGIVVQRCFIEHIDKAYVANGEIPTPQQFLIRTDVSDQVNEVTPTVRAEIDQQLVTLSRTSPPDIKVNNFCRNPDCPFLDHCFADVHPKDIVFLPGLQRRAIDDYRQGGVSTFDQIPADDLSSFQKRFVAAEQSGFGWMSEELLSVCREWRWPVLVIDFEAVAPTFPIWPSTRPYETVPFQWSAHLWDSPDAIPIHHEFLATDESDPRQAFGESLRKLFPLAGTVFTFTNYERLRLKELAAMGFEAGRDLLSQLEKTGVDLHAVLKRSLYLPAFKGSFSMKKVLPGLLGENPYDLMEVGGGDLAAIRYLEMINPLTEAKTRLRIEQALRTYCRMDTLAMIVVIQALLHYSERGDLEPTPVTFELPADRPAN